jgi:hypothetical protein
MIDSTTVAVGSYGTGSYIFTILIHSPTRSVGTSLPIFQYLFLGTTRKLQSIRTELFCQQHFFSLLVWPSSESFFSSRTAPSDENKCEVDILNTRS